MQLMCGCMLIEVMNLINLLLQLLTLFLLKQYFSCRPDLGIRIVCEQVSHHPPVSAFHVESELFVFHGSVHPKIKFWGKSVDITPKGLVTLVLKRYVQFFCPYYSVFLGTFYLNKKFLVYLYYFVYLSCLTVMPAIFL